jgi:hypothetical protein
MPNLRERTDAQSVQVLHNQVRNLYPFLGLRIGWTRSVNDKRVEFHIAPNPAPHQCRDVYMDGMNIGGLRLSDVEAAQYINSPAVKSCICILHEQGFTWDEISDFVWLTIEDNYHLQLRQIEVNHQLSVNQDAALSYYGLIHNAAQELASELTTNGIDVSSIFLAGGSALLLDPDNFPLQTNPKSRVANRMRKPKPVLKVEDLAETLSDVDIIVFVKNHFSGFQFHDILGRHYGRIFTPLGFESQRVIDEYPNRIGLDVIICEADNLANIISHVLVDDRKLPVTLVRHPDIMKPAESRIAPGLVTEMIPIWWHPGEQQQKDDYKQALIEVANGHELDQLLSGCSLASNARKILYSDRDVHQGLEHRWDMLRKGRTMGDVFEEVFGIQ